MSQANVNMFLMKTSITFSLEYIYLFSDLEESIIYSDFSLVSFWWLKCSIKNNQHRNPNLKLKLWQLQSLRSVWPTPVNLKHRSPLLLSSSAHTFPNMAGRRAALKAIDWAAFAERVPPNQRTMFNNLKTRSDAIAAKCVFSLQTLFQHFTKAHCTHKIAWCEVTRVIHVWYYFLVFS